MFLPDLLPMYNLHYFVDVKIYNFAANTNAIVVESGNELYPVQHK
jgi:hypothetical protein